MKKKRLRIYTAVFGDKHIDWFKRGCLESLSWPGNKEALDGAMWTFLTKREDRERLHDAVRASGINIQEIEYYLIDSNLPGNHPAMGNILLQGWLEELGRAITFGSQIFLAPPDTVFGDRTVTHLREVGEQRDSVVFMAHPRVTPALFSEMTGPMSNAQLVKASFKHLHKTWADAEIGLAQANSYIGGVSWRFLSESHYAVTHRLPTPYLINPTPEDIVYFKNQLHFGVLDHFWPDQCLISFERQRVIGSSDGAFCCEITPENENIPPTEHVRTDEPDLFWRSLSHNKVNRIFTIIFRGEP